MIGRWRTIVMLFGVAALGLSACHARYSRSDSGGTTLNGTRLDRTQSVLITLPSDGRYSGKQYTGSGQTVAYELAKAFSARAQRVEVSPAAMSDKSQAIEAAKAQNFGYVAIPTITQWEPRATEWSGRPSRASVQVTIIDVASGKDLGSSMMDSSSRTFTFTGTSPESLIPKMFSDYVSSIY